LGKNSDTIGIDSLKKSFIMSFVKKNRLFSQIFTTGILRGGVKLPTGGIAREPHFARMIR
jgi:hypothetical protein